MILTGPEIHKRISLGQIVISPYYPKHMGPNSYDVTLADELLVYTEHVLDMRTANPVRSIIIPWKEGLVLLPGELYLGKTVEYTESHGLVPDIDGRSSIGRLGINIHVCAGRGDVGFCGHWTLEITVTKPVRIYPGVRIGQLYFSEVIGEQQPYEGKYQQSYGVVPSRLYQDFEVDGNRVPDVGQPRA